LEKILQLMKITNEIFQVGGLDFTSGEDAAIYAIHFDGHAAIIDSGCGGCQNRLLKNIKDCGIHLTDIDYLLLTHCHYDHTGGASSFRKASHCKIVAHELDARFLEKGDNEVTAASWYGAVLEPFSVDLELTHSKEIISLGQKEITAYHIPGHSPGSVVYVAESEGQKVLFGQDVHGPIDPRLLSDRTQYQESLRLLLSLNADILCEGHFGIFEGKHHVRDFIGVYMN